MNFNKLDEFDPFIFLEPQALTVFGLWLRD